MAYLRSIEKQCQTCQGRATVELVNTFNGSMGVYCNRHGGQALKRLQAEEKG